MAKFKLDPILIILVALSLIAFAVLICLTQCNSLELDEPMEIEVWYSEKSTDTSFEAMVKSFNQGEGSEKLVSVKAKGYESEGELLDALKNALETDAELPDAVLCDCNISAYLQKNETLADADTYIHGWKSDLTDGEIAKTCTCDNETVSIPVFYETDVFIVNTGLYEEAENIASFEELCSVANTYYGENKKSFFTITDYSAFFNAAMAQLGEQFLAENPFDYENENVRYIYDKLATAAFKRGYAASAENPALLVSEDELACAVISTPQLMAAEKKLDLSEIKILPVPVMEGGEVIYTREVFGISILKGDENSETAAAIFTEWFTEDEQLSEFLGYSGYIPALKVSAANSDTADTVLYGELTQLLDDLTFADYNADPNYGENCYEFNDIMDNIMKKSLS